MSIELSSRIVRLENQMSAPMDNEIVILNMAKDNFIGLDDIGRFIWELLAEPYCVDELCNSLSWKFEATPRQIAADLLPFLEELKEEGLIRIEN
jgi:hypothetical protein